MNELSKMSCRVAERELSNYQRVIKLPRTDFQNTKVKSKTSKTQTYLPLTYRSCKIKIQTELKKSKLNQDELSKTNYRLLKFPKKKKTNEKFSKLKNEAKTNLNRIERWTKPKKTKRKLNLTQGIRTKSQNQIDSSKRIHQQILLFLCRLNTNKISKNQNIKQNFLWKVLNRTLNRRVLHQSVKSILKQ